MTVLWPSEDGFFFFKFYIFDSATSKIEFYRNVNDSFYYKNKIEYKKAMMHFVLLWEKHFQSYFFVIYHKNILRPLENVHHMTLEQNWNCFLFVLQNTLWYIYVHCFMQEGTCFV